MYTGVHDVHCTVTIVQCNMERAVQSGDRRLGVSRDAHCLGVETACGWGAGGLEGSWRGVGTQKPSATGVTAAILERCVGYGPLPTCTFASVYCVQISDG